MDFLMKLRLFFFFNYLKNINVLKFIKNMKEFTSSVEKYISICQLCELNLKKKKERERFQCLNILIQEGALENISWPSFRFVA